MTPYTVLVDAERRLSDLVQALRPADLDRPTPCAGWDVRALLSHTLTGIEIFASAADGAPAPTAEDMFGGADRLAGDPVAATKRATTRSQAAWADPGDPAAEVTTILGPLPLGQVLAISAFATIVHGWDLAIATAQPITELPDDLVAHAWAVADQVVPGLRAAPGDHGLFQQEVAAPEGSTPTRRLMAFLGRTPA